MPLEVGDPAPRIQARNQDGELVEPDFESPTILYFYPKDDTPGCTTEAAQFETEMETFRSGGVSVYGVSMDGVDSHAEFAADQGLSFDLLADPDGEIAAAFGVDTDGGRPDRTTFVLLDGEVKAVYTDVDPDGHAREVGLEMYDDELVEFDW